MPITISEGYVPGCIGRIAQLHGEYYAAAWGFGVAFEARVARELADFCTAYVSGRDGLWLARDSAIEGSIAIDGSHAQEAGAHLRWFFTSDALRGQGVGWQLLQAALRFSDDRGYRRVYLHTVAGLDAARHLYELHGFRLAQQDGGTQWGALAQEQLFVRDQP